MPTIDSLPPVPSRGDSATFSPLFEAFLMALQANFVPQANALASGVNLAATAIASAQEYISAVSAEATYTFSASTAVADPGAGLLRLNAATQNTATTLAVDVLDVGGVDVSALLDSFGGSTNSLKGYLRLSKATDASAFLIFSVSLVTTVSGYRNITVACLASSAASPFVAGDRLSVGFSRAGDKAVSSTTDVQVFSASGTWTKPAGAKFVLVELLGAGGGGGSGALGATSTLRTGGSGGGGGAYVSRSFAASVMGVNESVTIGAGGTAGASKTAAGPGNVGGQGGNTVLGALVTAYGGGAGQAGAVADPGPIGGGGGGAGGPGAVGFGGDPFTGFSASTSHANGGSGAGQGSAEYGGAGAWAVSSTSATGFVGGSSLYGGAAGGSGGGLTAGNQLGSAFAGGTTGRYQVGGGGAAGSSGAAGAAGSSGIFVASSLAGSAGGGGGAGNTTTGATGGAGFLGSGGGGGGAGTATSSGAGGAGGNGYCRITTFF